MTKLKIFKINYKRYWDNPYGYKILTSMPFMLLQTIIAGVFFNLNLPIVSLFTFAIIILVAMLTSKDLSPCLLPLLLVSMTLLKMYGSNIDTYKPIFPIGLTLIALLILRPLYLPVKFSKGAMFTALLGISFCITFGGLGSLKIDEYFQIIPLFYVFSLGIGMLLSYLLMRNYTFNTGIYRSTDTFVNTMLCVGIMGIIMVMPVAIEAIVNGNSWSIQWSNNLSTFMIFAMPFTFYKSVKVIRGGSIWFIIGALECLSTLYTLSRGGILFGFVTYILSAITAIIFADRNRRKIFMAIIIILAASATTLLFLEDTIERLMELLKVGENEARVNLFRLAVQNFLANPIFGTGLAYKGDYYNPQEWALYWYHSLPFQIIGSLGLVGVVAYAFLFYKRVQLSLVVKSKFNVFCLISMLGFTLMGCVNPGEFAPVPYAVLITAIMVYIELSNKKTLSEDEHFLIRENNKIHLRRLG